MLGEKIDKNMAIMDAAMTLVPYTPERLDELALRLYDVAGLVRQMGHTMRRETLAERVIHDRKALEWIDKLEDWCQKSEAGLEAAVRRARGARRAASFARPAAGS